jgi:hypothetical protein
LDSRRSRSQHEEPSHVLSAFEPTMPMHCYMVHSSDPQVYSDDVGNSLWEATMQEECDSLLKNQTWDLVPLPPGKKLVRCKWVYRTKRATNGQVSRYKARLVAKGFQQIHGIDYDETFAPVAKMESIRLVLPIATVKGWEVHQMNVKNVFLHGDLSKEIYMEKPQGFIQNSSLVCKLKKSFYGLKHAPRTWYEKMDSYLFLHDFIRCKFDSNVYMLRNADSLMILVLYVDDLLITGSFASAIVVVKDILHDRFSMMDMGPLHFFLGLEISQDASGIKLSQTKYAKDLLDRFHMTNCKSAPTSFLSGINLEDGRDTPLVDNTLYRQLVGSLLYLTHTRPDISYAVGVVSRYMQEPHDLHWKVVKCILRYVQGTMSYGIHYAVGCALDLIGFTDSDWVGDGTDRKSTSEYTLSLGSGPICWSSKKQSAIGLSSAEAEYRGVVNYII